MRIEKFESASGFVGSSPSRVCTPKFAVSGQPAMPPWEMKISSASPTVESVATATLPPGAVTQ